MRVHLECGRKNKKGIASAYLTHAGHTGNVFFDDFDDDRLSLVGAVLIGRR